MLQETSGVMPPLHFVQTHKPWSDRPGGQVAALEDMAKLADLSGRPALFSSFASIQARGDQQVDLAVRLRTSDKLLEQVDDLLAAIKERLLHIVKQYPPFSQESPQRISYLNSISGLRQQLDALAFPPEQEAGSLPVEASGPVKPVEAPFSKMLARGDLAIPELSPETASDAAVQGALDEVIALQQRVAATRAAMWEDVVRYVGNAVSGGEADFQAETQADAVRGYVIAHPGQGIGFNVHAVLSPGA